MEGHVFIDNSNIFGGAQELSGKKEPSVPTLAVRVYYKNLFKLLEHGLDVKTRMLAGSLPPGNEALWQHSKDANYDTDLLRRVEKDDGRIQEQGVDELVHLKILEVVCDFPPGRLVIATGDGNISEFNTSFPAQVSRALKKGWSVDLWTWRAQLSSAYLPVKKEFDSTFEIKYLDGYFNQITFVQGVNSPDVLVSVPSRVVRQLNLS
ncbi:NYN domain-containing protein [Pseudomonas tremae]|uniref:NYN domain-containing protein n=1 Tax=Pseudomonas tremae TaxID=200454 RepID=UPI0004670128|nr:NYN domain-containing protein [Pseudomonas tremae]